MNGAQMYPTRSKAAAAAGFLALCAAAGAAHAVQITPAPVLGPVSVTGYVAIHFLVYEASLDAPGTELLNPPIYVPSAGGQQGCTVTAICDLGTGIVSATLGNDPTVELGAMPIYGDEGVGTLRMSYQAEYFDPGSPAGTTVAATIDAADAINAGGPGGGAEAVMTVIGPTQIYSALDCSPAYGCGATPNVPFTDQAVTMVVNTPYTVLLSLGISGPVLAKIDPTFSAPASAGGEFVFSPGVTSGVPEPATWAAMLVGFGGVGAAMRRSRGKPSLSASAI